MTPLESKTIRDSRGINTYERGMLYATLLLITSNISPDNTKVGAANPYYEAIKLSFERGSFTKISNEEGDEKISEIIDPKVIIEAYLPYDQGLSLRTGGNFLEQIKDFGNKDPNPISISVDPDPRPYITIKEDPTWVNSLEKYLAWTATVMDFSGFYSLEIVRQVAISYVENSNKSTFIKINASLPYKYEAFLRNRNLLSALRSDYIK